MLEHRDLLEKAVVWAHVREHEAAVARCSEAAEVHGPRQVELYTRLLEQLAANRDELQQRLKEHVSGAWQWPRRALILVQPPKRGTYASMHGRGEYYDLFTAHACPDLRRAG